MWLDILKNKKSNEIFLWHQVNSHFYFDIYIYVCVCECVCMCIYIFIYISEIQRKRASLVAQMVKNLPAMMII